MRTLLTTAFMAVTLTSAALAQSPDPARANIDPPAAEVASPGTETAAPAENAVPTVRAVIGATAQTTAPRAAGEDGLAAASRWGRDAWQRTASLRAAFAEIAWIPLLLTLFNGLLALFAFRFWRTSRDLNDAVRAQSAAMTETISVLRGAAEATRQIADAVMLQARAAVGVELPRLELSAVHLVHADESIRQALKSPAVSLRFANHGRTTAFLTERCVELRLADALPAEPEYRAIEQRETADAVASGASIEAGAANRLGELSEDEVEALRLGRRTLWVYGFVAFRDFLGIEHRKGFCLRWLPPDAQAAIGGSFQPEGSETYLYEREEAGRGTRPVSTIPFVLTDRAPPLRVVEPVAAAPRTRARAHG